MTRPIASAVSDRRRVLSIAAVGVALSAGYLLLFAGQLVPGYVRISLGVDATETDLAVRECAARTDCAPFVDTYLSRQLHDLNIYATTVSVTNVILAVLQIAVLIAAAAAVVPGRPHRRGVAVARTVTVIHPAVALAGLLAQLAIIAVLSRHVGQILYPARLISYDNTFSYPLSDFGNLYYFGCFVAANTVTAIVWWVAVRAVHPR